MPQSQRKSSTRVAGDYVEVLNPRGYMSNAEITNLPGHFLVKGSQNVRIVNAEKVATSERYVLKGEPKVYNSPVVTSFDWKTNTGVYRNIKGFMGTSGELQVWYEDKWEQFKEGLKKIKFNFATWWDSNEQLDLLLGVNGTEDIYMWSGGITKLASVTANTLTKQGYFSGTSVAFNNNGANLHTITDTSKSLIALGFKAGDNITIADSSNNDGDYRIVNIFRDVLDTMDVIEVAEVLVNEAQGATLSLRLTDNGTWAESRFLVSTTNRSVSINGIEFTYTGGEDSGTLTGVTPDPTQAAIVPADGDLVFQSFMKFSPSELQNYHTDLIGMLNNHVYYGSTTSREVLVSANDDFKDFGYTQPLRVPGEGYLLVLDSTPTAIVPDEDEMYISAGDDDWYKVSMELNTVDLGGEAVSVRKLKTAPGQAAINQGAVAYIKNAVAFLSQERVLDTLGRVENIEGVQNKPISDDIKDDFEAYDITDAHALYYRRSLFVALPREMVVLEYDMRFGYWQPPQLFPVSRLAIIDNKLCGHSSTSNETYELYSGYSDNLATFKAVAAFGYENFGYRFSLKNFDEAAVELYISKNTIVKDSIFYEYKGGQHIEQFTLDGSDESLLFGPTTPIGLGASPLGSNPLGSTSDEPEVLSKMRKIHHVARLDFFERQRIFETDSPGARFEIIAYGENTKLSENDPSFIRR